jgi:Putative peptidoglycan binding domain
MRLLVPICSLALASIALGAGEGKGKTKGEPKRSTTGAGQSSQSAETAARRPTTPQALHPDRNIHNTGKPTGAANRTTEGKSGTAGKVTREGKPTTTGDRRTFNPANKPITGSTIQNKANKPHFNPANKSTTESTTKVMPLNKANKAHFNPANKPITESTTKVMPLNKANKPQNEPTVIPRNMANKSQDEPQVIPRNMVNKSQDEPQVVPRNMTNKQQTERAPTGTSTRHPINAANGPTTEKVPAGQFQQNRRIQGSDQWLGSDYEVFRNYRSEWHDRDWWRSHHPRIVFGAGGWYYWNSRYWFPAWGYDPKSNYEYDGPIYGHNDLPPDQVIADVQAALQKQGYYQGEADGRLGLPTRGAIADYQRDHGLYVTSAIDSPTHQSLQ